MSNSASDGFFGTIGGCFGCMAVPFLLFGGIGIFAWADEVLFPWIGDNIWLIVSVPIGVIILIVFIAWIIDFLTDDKRKLNAMQKEDKKFYAIRQTIWWSFPLGTKLILDKSILVHPNLTNWFDWFRNHTTWKLVLFNSVLLDLENQNSKQNTDDDAKNGLQRLVALQNKLQKENRFILYKNDNIKPEDNVASELIKFMKKNPDAYFLTNNKSLILKIRYEIPNSNKVIDYSDYKGFNTSKHWKRLFAQKYLK